ncbi:hypothetical protein C5748_09900 [Phyllobacterium phragmitis]|uniref:CoA transferase n=1 Tax=Phyllobacterium phragmitis TaxID=2670329 RepID=A0A2S9ISV6_9HYPH|nr:CoA transferase [Phyllobacterium phragmitis]PRD43570.1 hypothetical protein C5748_09900 [Phyllobacterium phragmitis]
MTRWPSAAISGETLLDTAGVPAAKVRSLDEVLREDHAQTRAFVHAMPWQHQPGAIHLPTLGFKANREVIAPTVAPPQLGHDTRTVLQGLGYSEADLARLEKDAVI